uniref:Fat storage-inducing transmembrane protein 2 n=1 Tax=Eptatretus burgeri TaxID=7764 RepID=A0A8C4N3G5_EPTBU
MDKMEFSLCLGRRIVIHLQVDRSTPVMITSQTPERAWCFFNFSNISSRAACAIVPNGVWNGFDISGHAFLLTYCILLLRSELFASHTKASNRWLHFLERALVIALLCLMCLWLWMLIWTLLYFHIWIHKIVGAAFAFLAWGFTYGLWFGRPFSTTLRLKHIR